MKRKPVILIAGPAVPFWRRVIDGVKLTLWAIASLAIATVIYLAWNIAGRPQHGWRHSPRSPD